MADIDLTDLIKQFAEFLEFAAYFEAKGDTKWATINKLNSFGIWKLICEAFGLNVKEHSDRVWELIQYKEELKKYT